MLRPDTLALTTLLAMLTALGPLTTDMYLPSMPDIARALHAPIADVQLTFSSYLIGFAFGQILYGPFSDRYGRRPVLFAALVLYATATLVCAAAQSIDTLIAARFVQAVGGAGAIVLPRAMVRDMYSGVRAGRELSLIGAIMGFAPIVAPVIGGVLQAGFGWRSNFIVLGTAAAIGIAVVAKLLPETLTRRLAEPISPAYLFKDYASVLRHRGFSSYLAIITAMYSGLFAWVSGGAIVLQENYGLSPLAFGITFGMTAVGYILGTMVATRVVGRLGLDRCVGLGVMLIAAGSIAQAAVVAAGVPQAYWLAGAMVLYLGGLGLALPQSMAGALTPFPDRAGTASSVMGFIPQAVSAIAAAIVGAYLGRSAWPVSIAVCIMGTLSLVLWAATRGLRAPGR
jgi:DHA1 family bicyclomycin/chloramphenicol resistance-like MFS transporter